MRFIADQTIEQLQSRWMSKILCGGFILMIALLPFAEWRFIGLPLHDRPWRIDLDGDLSVSAFDFALVALLLACIADWRRLLSARLFDFHLVPWGIGFLLVGMLYVSLQPHLPWLTPSRLNVIDTRAFAIHLVLGCVVLLVVAITPIERLLRGATVFFVASTAGALLLVYFALVEFPYFRFHYPFNVATTISFPFPSQGPAAIFLAVCLLGALGTAVVTGSRLLLIASPAVLLPAIVLTGSRTGFFLASFAALAFVVALASTRLSLGAWRIGTIRTLITGFICASLALVLIHDRQPVQRVFHLLREFAQDPRVLVVGQRGSPRSELWSIALSRRSLGTPQYGTEYSLALVTVRNGCVDTSSSIGWLRTGVPYIVKLTMDAMSRVANLDVYDDPGRTQKVGELKVEVGGLVPRDFLALGADSARTFTVATGELKNYRLTADGVSRPMTLAGQGRAEVYEEPFNGGVTRLFNVTAGAVRFDADMRILRGHVATRGILEDVAKLELEYELLVERVPHADTLEKPDVFYVGLLSNVSRAAGDRELLVPEGLLIQHLRKTSKHVQGIQVNALVEELASRMRTKAYSGKGDRDILADFTSGKRCGAGGKLPLSGLWTPPIGPDMVDRARRELAGQFMPRWATPANTELSILPDSTWSSERHLQLGGSTHNVFLDWYRYIGPLHAAVFALFVLSLNVATATFAWKMRRSAYFPLILAAMLQLIVITGALYAQPNLFLKYYWFVFGMASGLAINPQLVRTSAPRPT